MYRTPPQFLSDADGARVAVRHIVRIDPPDPDDATAAVWMVDGSRAFVAVAELERLLRPEPIAKLGDREVYRRA